jgi:dolichol-phosphate mannosyltransferase
MKYEKIGIIIPAYNEESRIGKMLEEYSKYFQNKGKQENKLYSILVVINNTQDKTEEVVKSAIKKSNIVSYINLNLGGKGYAVTQGFKMLLNKKYDYIGFVDADLSTPPKAFYDLLLNIGEYSGVIGNRWSKDSIIPHKQTLLRRLASRVFNFMVKIFFFMNYQDTQCGAKIFRAEELSIIIPKVFITQWAFDVNLLYLYKINNFKIIEIPTIWQDKNMSHVDTIRASIKMFSGIMRLRLIYSPFYFVIRLYDKLPAFLKINHTLVK